MTGSLLLSLLLLSASPGRASCLGDISAELGANDRNLSENAFETGRGYGDYRLTFPGLKETFEALKVRAEREHYKPHWLDSGAGSAAALLDFYLDMDPEGRFRLTAVGKEKPRDNEGPVKMLAEKCPDFRYLDKRYLEDIPNAEIGPVDVITDYFGPAAYTARFDLVLNKYLGILRVGGKIFLLDRQTTWINGKLPFDYLAKINGISVKRITRGERGEAGLRFPGDVYVLTKESARVEVPELLLSEFTATRPPTRSYREKPSQ